MEAKIDANEFYELAKKHIGALILHASLDDSRVRPFDAETLLARIQSLIAVANERKTGADRQAFSYAEGMPATYEEKLVARMRGLVKQNVSDSTFSIAMLARHFAMSDSRLSRVLKKTTGLTPGQFIRDIRLQRATYLLETRQYMTISEVVYAVGFEDISSFSRLFKRRFGKSPSAFAQAADA